MSTSTHRILALFVCAAAPAAAVTTASPAAFAADASASPASDDIALTGGQVISLEKKMKDTTDWATDPAKRDSGKTAIEGVESGLKRIKKKDPKWDVSTWESLVKTARARLKKAEDVASAKDAADKANEDSYREYVGKLSTVREGFDLLVKLDKNPGSVDIYSKNQIVGNMAKAIASVDALAKACNQKAYDKLTIPSFYKKDPPAADACKLAERWKTLGQTYMDLQVKGGVPKEVKRLQGVVGAATKGEYVEASDHNGLLDPEKHIERYRKDYDAAAKLLGATVAASAFEGINGVAKSYADALTEAQKVSRFDPKSKIVDPAAAAAVAKQYKKGGSMGEGQVIKVAAAYDWSVKTNILDRPVSRERDVHVLVKVKGESFCRVYFRDAFQAYQLGAWKPMVVSGGESKFRISACK